MPAITFLGTTTPSDMLAAVGTTVGSVWDSFYLFFAFAAGLGVAFYVIRAVISLMPGRRSRH